MTTSNQNYKDYSFADHKEVYLKLEKAFRKFGVHYYLIGANARDVQLYKAGVKPMRGTADIDFAVMVPDLDVYKQVLDELQKNGFEKTPTNLPYRLFHSDTNTAVDLLPYGKFTQQYTVNFNERSLELSVLGMYEVGTQLDYFEHPEGITIPVSTAHGLVILKLIAWSEKPTRTKDLSDIKTILDSAWEMYLPELHQPNSPYADLFEEDNFDTHLAAARVMGRKIRSIINQSDQLRKVIISELIKEQSENSNTKSEYLATTNRTTIEEIQRIFNAMFKGIND